VETAAVSWLPLVLLFPPGLLRSRFLCTICCLISPSPFGILAESIVSLSPFCSTLDPECTVICVVTSTAQKQQEERGQGAIQHAYATPHLKVMVGVKVEQSIVTVDLVNSRVKTLGDVSLHRPSATP
jgi:hypothetical protein